MRLRLTRATGLAAVCAAMLAPADASGRAAASPAPGFFGIAPQTPLTERDIEYMRAGGIGAIRVPVPWSMVQPTPDGGFEWRGVDATVALAARARLAVLPFLYGTPRWLARRKTTLPIDSARARRAWVAFVTAAVERYGPGGDFWDEHGAGATPYEPAIPNSTPVRTWQVWNEANFFYFAYPVSPTRYAKLLKISSMAVKRVDPGAKIVLSGLFGEPDERGKRGMPAAQFLTRLYKVPGVKAAFDGVALHPYAVDAETLAELTERMRQVVLDNHDARTPLFITEMGWGSQNDFRQVAFEQGPRGQARQLRDSYRYLLANRTRLNLKATYWFSWKDADPGPCNFCDSVGLFHAGPAFHPKPAWHAFVALSGGRTRPEEADQAARYQRLPAG